MKIYEPMLAVEGTAFDSADHVFELKWDGYRILAHGTKQGVRLFSRHSKELTEEFPEIPPSLDLLPYEDFVLDGEMVVLDEEGKPDFSQLKSRGKRLTLPATYVIFDLLYLDGKDYCNQPWSSRRLILEEIINPLLTRESGRLLLSRYIREKGVEFFQLVHTQGLEGIMAKKTQSLYLPGMRTNDWIKIKNAQQAHFVIGGYLPKAQGLKSLCLGLFQGDELVYVGNVGSGLSDQIIQALLTGFKQIEVSSSPFQAIPRAISTSIWVRPILVAVISYLELTNGGYLRHPVFKGLTSQVSPKECRVDTIMTKER